MLYYFVYLFYVFHCAPLVFQLTRTTAAVAAARRTETDEITGRWPRPSTTPVVRTADDDER